MPFEFTLILNETRVQILTAVFQNYKMSGVV